MPGFSITLLLLPSKSTTLPTKDVILHLLDSPTSAPGWKWSSAAQPGSNFIAQDAPPSAAAKAGTNIMKVRTTEPAAFTAAVERACRALDAAEGEITSMDSVAGDGDCGLTLQAGAHGTLSSAAPPSCTNDISITNAMDVLSSCTGESAEGHH